MNLVTTGNGAISLATCLVGLALFLPRSHVMTSVRYVMITIHESTMGKPVPTVIEKPIEIIVSDTSAEQRELVDA